MTESEARSILKAEIVHHPECSIFAEALDVAIQALEKQIPKKPKKNFEKFSGVWCDCGKYLGKGYFVNKTTYCPDCGQKLDWSDKESEESNERNVF